MHEFSIAEQIVKHAVWAGEQGGAARVREVHLQVGTLQQISADALDFAFQAIAKDTLAEGAALIQTVVPLEIRCSVCGVQYAPPDKIFWVCPTCESVTGEVVAGDELIIDSVVVETAPEGDSAETRPSGE